ncbi:MAG: radical SAM protein [Candidatus Methanofastidiosa archaeon]|nr:radical SAM protein [Candidatus Methanofastidiosa archaeon]
MTVTEISSKTILLKHKKIDSWFLSRYGMNLYRGCAHNCSYCDGRAEGYRVEGEFGRDVTVKINAMDVLKRELDPRRKRTSFKGGYMMVGGGVGDSYQPLEEKYLLTRGALRLLLKFNHPAHILTKSTMVERDLDIIERIAARKGAVVSFSFSSADDGLGSIFEPGVPLPSERLETISKCKERGIPCGIFLLPVIPFLTDDESHLDQCLKAAKDVDADFIIFGGMTLKDGRQKEHFYDVLRENAPDLVERYDGLYPGDRWGNAAGDYYDGIQKRFYGLAKDHGIPLRMPPHLYKGLLGVNDTIIVILEHIDYLLSLRGSRPTYGRAAYEISKIEAPLGPKSDLSSIRGVGERTREIIMEIIETGASKYYEKLIYGGGRQMSEGD